MPDPSKPHRRISESHGVVFWNGNIAGNEDIATRAVVYVGPPGMPYPEFEFEWPRQKHEVARLEVALARAFVAGALAAKKEVRAVLGIPEAR